MLFGTGSRADQIPPVFSKYKLLSPTRCSPIFLCLKFYILKSKLVLLMTVIIHLKRIQPYIIQLLAVLGELSSG